MYYVKSSGLWRMKSTVSASNYAVLALSTPKLLFHRRDFKVTAESSFKPTKIPINSRAISSRVGSVSYSSFRRGEGNQGFTNRAWERVTTLNTGTPSRLELSARTAVSLLK